MLSRAFRNRFVELHFDEIPHNELEFILHKRCSLPLSSCKKMIRVMSELQVELSSSSLSTLTVCLCVSVCLSVYLLM